jgi:glycosyltransferase involved in cell wall biosynthesis
MVEDAYVDVIPNTPLAKSFCELMHIKTVTDDAPMSLNRTQLLTRMAQNSVNLYVTFTECSPMIPLESFEVGVPCIIGNNTDFFKGNKLEDLVVVKEEDSIDEIYEKINNCINNKEEIMSLYREWKKEYSSEVIRLKEEFLNA